MDVTTVLRKLEKMLQDALASKMYGTIEIEFRHGVPVLFRTIKTEKTEEQPRNGYHQ